MNREVLRCAERLGVTPLTSTDLKEGRLVIVYNTRLHRVDATCTIMREPYVVAHAPKAGMSTQTIYVDIKHKSGKREQIQLDLLGFPPLYDAENNLHAKSPLLVIDASERVKLGLVPNWALLAENLGRNDCDSFWLPAGESHPTATAR